MTDFIRVDGNFRDLNYIEVDQIKREFDYYKSAMLPQGHRRPFADPYDLDSLDSVRRDYDIETGETDIEYVQHFIDRKKKTHIGFAVRPQSDVAKKTRFLLH